MWKQVIIQKSNSPWISPLNLVMKKKSDDALIVERWMILGYMIKMVLNQILKIFARFWNGLYRKMLLKYVKCYEWLRVENWKNALLLVSNGCFETRHINIQIRDLIPDQKTMNFKSSVGSTSCFPSLDNLIKLLTLLIKRKRNPGQLGHYMIR